MKKTSAKLCPTHRHFFAPTLRALDNLGGSGTNDEIYKAVLTIMQLPQEVVDEMHSFTESELEYKLRWARTYLKNYGALERSQRGVWSLTAKGSELLKAKKLDVREIVRFTDKMHGNSADVTTEGEKNWREQVSNVLHNLNPYAFERLAQLLLRECGFSEVNVTKKSGDGGIDGTGKLRIQGIFSFNVAFQCKRYKGTVGPGEIRDFRGSLDTNIEKGVLITTGAFTSAAREEAASPGKRLIDLMDGEELINKMAEYGIGLKPVPSYEVQEDFFNSLGDEQL